MISGLAFKYVLGCVFYDDCRLLIVERGQNMPSYRGQLGFFGGGIKPPKEHIESTSFQMEYLKKELLREVLEETGLEEKNFQYAEYMFDDYTYDGSAVAVFRLAIKSKMAPIPQSNGEWRRFGVLDCKNSCSQLFFHPLRIENSKTKISRDMFLVSLYPPFFEWKTDLKIQQTLPVMLWGMSARVLKKILDQSFFYI